MWVTWSRAKFLAVLTASTFATLRSGKPVCRRGLAEHTWIKPLTGPDGFVLSCWVCQAAGVENAFSKGVRCKNFGNLMRRHKSASHVGALETLGLAEASEDALLQGAPSIESFQQVLDHRCKDRALRQGCAAGGGKKMARMEHCLQLAMSDLDKEFLQDAQVVSIFQDTRQHWLSIRYRACDSQLRCRVGLIGFENLGTESGSYGAQRAVERAFLKFFTDSDGSVQQSLLDKVRGRVELFVADAASEETVTGRLLHASGYFPRMRFRSFDRAHACQRFPICSAR